MTKGLADVIGPTVFMSRVRKIAASIVKHRTAVYVNSHGEDKSQGNLPAGKRIAWTDEVVIGTAATDGSASGNRWTRPQQVVWWGKSLSNWLAEGVAYYGLKVSIQIVARTTYHHCFP